MTVIVLTRIQHVNNRVTAVLFEIKLKTSEVTRDIDTSSVELGLALALDQVPPLLIANSLRR